jgi:hypothetical protein
LNHAYSPTRHTPSIALHRSFPIQEDDHLLTVHRYIERNPVRAGLPLIVPVASVAVIPTV